MSWRRLRECNDLSLPKLALLARACRRGVRVPRTVWAMATGLQELPHAPAALGPGPWIVRSASPTEDTQDTSNAGQMVTCNLDDPLDREAWAEALADVLEGLPHVDGVPQGAVFVQPRLTGGAGGVAFFDGFYYERTEAAGGNQELTAGTARGEVVHASLERQDPFSTWIEGVLRALPEARGEAGACDLEYHRDGDGTYTLLQARPALFPLERNRLLSLANHRETLGEVPSPWIVGVLRDAGRRCPEWYAPVVPGIQAWGETYAVEVGGRAWMNFSFFFRLMDHLGLPRAWVTEGVGGESSTRAPDRAVCWGRFFANAPRLVLLLFYSGWTAWTAERALQRLDEVLLDARSPEELYEVGVVGMTLAVTTNFGIGGIWTNISRVRKLLGIRGSARPPTQEMMEAYEGLRRLPAEDRARELEGWLARFGHRGPQESDPARPRFAELSELLREDLTRGEAGGPMGPSREPGAWERFWFWIDHRREWFRDELMKRWAEIRRRLLEVGERWVEVGDAEAPEDVFLLDRAGLDEPDRAAALARARERSEAARRAEFPDTARERELREVWARQLRETREPSTSGGDGGDAWPAIALVPRPFVGPVVRADDLLALLARSQVLGPEVVLVVPTLEPSWAVVFPRVGAVVADVGGELSHASILLREAGKPAMVNARGVYRSVQEGDRLELDPERGEVRRLP